LRNGVPAAGGLNAASPDTIKAMAPEMTFDFFSVRAEWREGGRQEDHAQHRLHRSPKVLFVVDREWRAQLRAQVDGPSGATDTILQLLTTGLGHRSFGSSTERVRLFGPKR
jgi:alkyl sulfatase BDS1-like metallo-beta-lactamase superfamily hydrolase